MKWKAGTSQQLPDAVSRLLRPGAANHSIDDAFPDDASSDKPTDYIGPRDPVLDGQPLNNLELLGERLVDREGFRVSGGSTSSARKDYLIRECHPSAIVYGVHQVVLVFEKSPGRSDDLASAPPCRSTTGLQQYNQTPQGCHYDALTVLVRHPYA